MRVRSLLILTALVSAILGGIAAYLALTVPNDLRAGSLLKDARSHLSTGKTSEARDALTKVVQQYPRTDAAAAAIVALVTLEEQERQRLEKQVAELRAAHEGQTKTLGELTKNVEGATTAAKAATTAAEQAKLEAEKAAKAKATTTAKKPPAKRTTKRPTRRKR
ncbi:MAG TPA: hypothetical protein VF057_02530 [Thermoanaerobaculia bacterium]